MSDTYATAPFDAIMEHLLDNESSSRLFEHCMDLNTRDFSGIPMRYRIIAYGFTAGLDLGALNEELEKHGCAKLYARNFWESTLIYAFHNKLSYRDWRKLESGCAQIRDSATEHDAGLPGKKITLNSLRTYIDQNSDGRDGNRYTLHRTRFMQEAIEKTDAGLFESWLKENISMFSSAREKTRYYFCKYLLYYLEAVREQYVEAVRTGKGLEDALDRAAVFKVLAELKRTRLSEAEIRDKIDNAAVSPGELFDSFNYFYFGYVSQDWMDVQLEYYGNPESLPAPMRRKLASSMRNYNRKLKNMTDDEIIAWAAEEIERTEQELDFIHSKDNPDRGYQRGRSGENAVRKFIQGALDPDRITLISFLIFFGSMLRGAQAITEDRLNSVLRECGFAALSPADTFDSFVIRFLKSEDPALTLMEEVNRFALEEKNFYLYRLYRMSENTSGRWKRLMGQPE